MHSLCPVYVHTQSYLIACILYINGRALIFHVCIHTLKDDQLTLSQPGAQDPRWSQKHHKKSWISKPASKATKAMTVAPKATQNHEKIALETREIQFLRKSFFATLPLPRARFCNPRHPNWSTKQAKWQPWATSSGIKEPAGQRAIQPIRTQSLKAMRTYIHNSRAVASSYKY